jgi:hypothetical protein
MGLCNAEVKGYTWVAAIYASLDIRYEESERSQLASSSSEERTSMNCFKKCKSEWLSEKGTAHW